MKPSIIIQQGNEILGEGKMQNNLRKKLSNLHKDKRFISGAVIGLVFLIAIFIARGLFFVLMMGVAAMMLIEWYNITHKKNQYLYSGLAIIPLPIASVLFISNIDQSGWLLFSFFAIIWCTDIVAMYAGKAIEGPKLAPALSPHKTISGLCAGVFAASMLPLLFNLLPWYDISNYLPGCKFTQIYQFGLLALLAQMSDLFISYFKRKFKVKDSGDIIPGHGGMLDRFDSIVLTAPIVALYLCM